MAMPVPADPDAKFKKPTQEEYDREPNLLEEDAHIEPLGLWDYDDDDLLEGDDI